MSSRFSLESSTILLVGFKHSVGLGNEILECPLSLVSTVDVGHYLLKIIDITSVPGWCRRRSPSSTAVRVLTTCLHTPRPACWGPTWPCPSVRGGSPWAPGRASGCVSTGNYREGEGGASIVNVFCLVLCSQRGKHFISPCQTVSLEPLKYPVKNPNLAAQLTVYSHTVFLDKIYSLEMYSNILTFHFTFNINSIVEWTLTFYLRIPKEIFIRVYLQGQSWTQEGSCNGKWRHQRSHQDPSVSRQSHGGLRQWFLVREGSI